MDTSIRIAWSEVREGELFFLIADLVAGHFTFSERSSFEVRWYDIVPTERLIGIARALLATGSARDAA